MAGNLVAAQWTDLKKKLKKIWSLQLVASSLATCLQLQLTAITVRHIGEHLKGGVHSTGCILVILLYKIPEPLPHYAVKSSSNSNYADICGATSDFLFKIYEVLAKCMQLMWIYLYVKSNRFSISVDLSQLIAILSHTDCM